MRSKTKIGGNSLEHQKKGQAMDMLHGPLTGKIFLFTLPIMFSSVLHLLFNAADIIVVGRFAGSNALAAEGSNSALVNLLVGLSVGSAVTVAFYYGKIYHHEYSDGISSGDGGTGMHRQHRSF